MASKVIYSSIAVIGIAAASVAAYWYQSKPHKPTEITTAGPGAPAPAAPSASSARGGGPGGPGGPVAVEVAKVEVSRLQDDAQSVGSMRSRQNVMVRPEVAGRIMSLGFTDGGRVRKGDVIVQLDDVLQRAEVRQADAQVSISRANLKRNQDLVAQSFIAQRVVDESAANLQVVEAQLALACARLDRMRVTAPFDGTVGIRNINIGDYVKDGADLVNIEDLSSMYVDFKLPERFQGKLRKGQPVEMELDAMPGRKFKARIEAIDPTIDANGRSISVRAVMPNTAGESARPAGGGTGAGAGAGAGGASGASGRPGATAGMANKEGGKPALRAAGASARPALADAQAATQELAQRATAGRPAASSDAVANACAPYSNAGAPRRPGAGGVGQNTAVPAGLAGAVGASGGRGEGTGPLRPGMFARVTAVFNVNDASISVPEEAIVPQGGRQFVIKVVEQTEEQFKVLAEVAKKAAAAAAPVAGSSAAGGGGGITPGASGAPGATGGAPAPQPPVFVNGVRLVSQRTEVKIGIRRPGRVEILEGVKDGDTVVVAGQQRLQRDAIPVRIIEIGRPGGGQGGAQGAVSGAPAAPSASAAR
jgi:multidrug efflux pump subunit AcrA (membrane-fusion protein)